MSPRKAEHESGGNAPQAVSFEDALRRLQQTVEQLESGELGLEQALAHFETAMGLLKDCYGLLSHAEQRVEVLTRLNPDGSADTAEFDATTSLEKSESARTRRSQDDSGENALF